MAQGSPPTTKWQQPFDASLTDVFQVQADIAGRVAQALDVALGAGVQQQLAEKPTRNLAAYDAYLKGVEAYARGGDPHGAAPGARPVRAGGRARYDLRRRLGAAVPVGLVSVQPRNSDTGARVALPGGRAARLGAGPRPAGGPCGPRRLLSPGRGRQFPCPRRVRQGPDEGPRQRGLAARERPRGAGARPLGFSAGSPAGGADTRSPLRHHRHRLCPGPLMAAEMARGAAGGGPGARARSR